jgi:hypothetical protein
MVHSFQFQILERSVLFKVYKKMSVERSIHSAGIEEIYNMPITEINRPIPSVLDLKKVDSIANTLQKDTNAVPPLDVRKKLLNIKACNLNCILFSGSLD